jgi:MFS transporter, MHS family, citrate/tricarballylate:H+ symporter
MVSAPLNLTFRQITGVVVGNGLEFYDFLIYTFYAPQIGRTLFPTAGGYDLVLSLGTFAVGFLTRPIGAFVIGRLADRVGRRPALVVALALMGIATVGMFTSPFTAIGILAPGLAILFRLVQGFAV